MLRTEGDNLQKAGTRANDEVTELKHEIARLTKLLDEERAMAGRPLLGPGVGPGKAGLGRGYPTKLGPNQLVCGAPSWRRDGGLCWFSFAMPSSYLACGALSKFCLG